MYDHIRPEPDKTSFYTLVSDGKHSPGTYSKIALMYGKPQQMIRNTKNARIVRQDFINIGSLKRIDGKYVVDVETDHLVRNKPKLRKHKGIEVLEQYRKDAAHYNRFPEAYAAIQGLLIPGGGLFPGDQSVNPGSRKKKFRYDKDKKYVVDGKLLNYILVLKDHIRGVGGSYNSRPKFEDWETRIKLSKRLESKLKRFVGEQLK